MMHRKILSNWLITANSFNGAVFFKFTALRYHNFLGGLFEASTSLAKILYALLDDTRQTFSSSLKKYSCM